MGPANGLLFLQSTGLITRRRPRLAADSNVCMMSSRSRGASLAIAAAAAAFLAQAPAALSLSDAQKLVAEAWRAVDQAYVDRTFSGQDWFRVRQRAVKRAYESMDEGYGAIRTMLASLGDPYTRFLTPDQYASLVSTATGDLVGVGVQMFPAPVEGRIVVTGPMDGSPAARAGVRPRDAISYIDGEDVEGLSPDDAAARIRGPPGSDVAITVKRDEGKGEETTLVMKRERLRLQSVSASSLNNGKVTYLRIKQFNEHTAEDVKAALEQAKGNKRGSIVLDLRNNPGGYFSGGVDVARLFLKSGDPIVYVLDKNGIQDEIDAISDGLASDSPMVVLVNKGTASASEILAGALKDNGRATLVGEKTFGKAVVQTVSPLSDGSGIAITVARYETPKHSDINKVGIFPNVEAPCAMDAEVVSCLPTRGLL